MSHVQSLQYRQKSSCVSGPSLTKSAPGMSGSNSSKAAGQTVATGGSATQRSSLKRRGVSPTRVADSRRASVLSRHASGPVFTSAADLARTHDNFEGFRDRVIAAYWAVSFSFHSQAHGKQIPPGGSWSQRVRELTSVVVSLLELSAHISYLMAVRCGEGEAGAVRVQGPVDTAHRLTQADLDIRFSCQRLKRSRRQ
ncbi:hypothetical protein RRG08_066119 [Elysia crispata]|uniref:Uncharacterized protein n=1 Tax=Elysia crispata TaxID=231223 RepID=A0AAE1A992_9GAST|nr:hypothetical protein RRG08_066119 [Elysia crispata]